MKPPRIRLGMVGGGEGAFIGAVHRTAARLDDRFELVAGAFSSDPERARRSAEALGVARSYDDFEAMAREEAAREDGIEAVAIVTPNHLHWPAARPFLAAGIHVICDKPMTSTLEDARAMAEAVRASPGLFVLTHNYTATPMVRHARAMVRDGAIGEVRVVQVEYPQDWLSRELDNKQAAWRTDPARSGAGGAVGDIGTHAYHLAGYVSGLRVSQLLAELSIFVPGRRLDDNAHVLLRYEGGARGMLWASQVAAGNENALRLRVYGTEGGLEWAQEEPNHLWHAPLGEPRRLLTRGSAAAGEDAARLSRIPVGHPEGYLEAFANLYAEAAEMIEARREGREPDPTVHAPGVEDGLAGVLFVDACVRSAREGGAWVNL